MSAVAGAGRTGVLHVVESWPPVVSGYTSRGAALVAAQQRRDDLAPAVLVTSRQHLYGSWSGPTVPAGLEGRVHALAPSPSERLRRRARRWAVDGAALARAVEGAAREGGADVVHAHFSSVIGAASAAGARRAGVPLVAEVRFDLAGAALAQSGRWLPPRAAGGLEAPLRRWFERHLAGADAVVAASASLGELLAATVPSIAGRLTVVPNGVDAQRFSPGPPPQGLRESLGLQGAVVIGSTARMLRYEGLDLLVEAVARLARTLPRVRLLLVGGGPEEARLRALASRLGAPVVFAGTVPPERVADHYRLLDVFAVPRRSVAVTRWAAPIKLAEAMAAGLAVVASPVGDVPDVVRGDRGLLSPAGDLDALTAALADLVEDPDRRRALGAAARAWAVGAGTWDAAAASDAQVYRDVLPAERVLR